MISHLIQETGKKETISRSYFFLAHNPLDLDDDDCDLLKLDHNSWLHLLVESCGLLPILQYGKDSLRNILTHPLPPNGWQDSIIWYLRDQLSWTWILNHDEDHHLKLSSHVQRWTQEFVEAWVRRKAANFFLDKYKDHMD
jgi:hypothetical protein